MILFAIDTFGTLLIYDFFSTFENQKKDQKRRCDFQKNFHILIIIKPKVGQINLGDEKTLFNHLNLPFLVCIIGAGAGGLCAIRNFLKHKDKFEIELFEKTNSVGGTWVYNENREKDEFGLPIHSSMYANLR